MADLEDFVAAIDGGEMRDVIKLGRRASRICRRHLVTRRVDRRNRPFRRESDVPIRKLQEKRRMVFEGHLIIAQGHGTGECRNKRRSSNLGGKHELQDERAEMN